MNTGDTTFTHENKFKINVHNQAFETVTTRIESRFKKYCDLFIFLDPKNVDAV